MNQLVPEIIRIGVANARIKCVTPQRVEYLDEAGQECFVDLDECARNWVQSLTEEDEDDGAMRNRRYVGERGLLADPPWIEFANERRTRFEFGSLNDGYGLIIPLKKVRCLTIDCS